MALVIGLTGGIATGKSSVAGFFKDADIPVIETDVIAKNVLAPGTEAYQKTLELFGDDILIGPHEINRKALAKAIFEDEKKRKALNKIVHPEVKTIAVSQANVYKKEGHAMIIVDVPLLFEAGFDAMVDATMVVTLPKAVQTERLMARDGISKSYALKKINAQMPLKEKKKLADYAIDNQGSILDTKKQFLDILKQLKERVNGAN